jgi:peptidoglycan hydrolase CwlO-like protein
VAPDSPDTRLRALEQDVSALKQKVDDTVNDVRAFAPMLAAQAETRATLAHFQSDLAQIQRQIGQLENRIADEVRQRKEERERDRREREQGQEQRKTQDRTNRTLLWAAAIGMTGTMMLAIAAVVAAVIG